MSWAKKWEGGVASPLLLPWYAPQMQYSQVSSIIIFQGEIKIQATLMQGSKRLGCYEVDTSLKVKSSVKV